MIEVYPKIWVGDAWDYETYASRFYDFAVVHACKEPYHRQAVGYRGRAAPKDHPEYLVAQRDNRLMLNMIDSDNPDFFSQVMIWQALKFIEEHHGNHWRVLIHCNQGESRGPSLAMLYLSAWLGVIPNESLEEAEQRFRKLYPNYHPKAGIRGHLQECWEQYRNE